MPSLQRINLNVPAQIRVRLRRIARKLSLTESETARQLLTSALDQSERQEFYRRIAAAQTPASRQKELDIVAAFEKLVGL